MYRAAIQEGKLVLQKTLQLCFNHDSPPPSKRFDKLCVFFAFDGLGLQFH